MHLRSLTWRLVSARTIARRILLSRFGEFAPPIASPLFPLPRKYPTSKAQMRSCAQMQSYNGSGSQHCTKGEIFPIPYVILP